MQDAAVHRLNITEALGRRLASGSI